MGWFIMTILNTVKIIDFEDRIGEDFKEKLSEMVSSEFTISEIVDYKFIRHRDCDNFTIDSCKEHDEEVIYDQEACEYFKPTLPSNKSYVVCTMLGDYYVKKGDEIIMWNNSDSCHHVAELLNQKDDRIKQLEMELSLR